MSTTTLPVLQQTIDDFFTNTWYEIRAEAADNILDENVVWNILRERGVMTEQVGGEFITRTIRYGKKMAKEFHKGSVLTQGETRLKTMARWNWKYIATHVQQDRVDNQKNAGKFQIASLVADELMAAREALVEKFESSLFNTFSATAEGDTPDDTIQGLTEMIPDAVSTSDNTNRAQYTYGYIARPTNFTSDLPTTGNVWQTPHYKVAQSNAEINLLDDMENLYNTIGANRVGGFPNLIVTTQALYEIFSQFALDIAQTVVDDTSRIVTLGFEAVRFHGKPVVWTPNCIAGNMYMLNTDHMEVVFDPNMWFDMTEWVQADLSTTRLAHIMCALNIISDQLRRHGLLYNAT